MSGNVIRLGLVVMTGLEFVVAGPASGLCLMHTVGTRIRGCISTRGLTCLAQAVQQGVEHGLGCLGALIQAFIGTMAVRARTVITAFDDIQAFSTAVWLVFIACCKLTVTRTTSLLNLRDTARTCLGTGIGTLGLACLANAGAEVIQVNAGMGICIIPAIRFTYLVVLVAIPQACQQVPATKVRITAEAGVKF